MLICPWVLAIVSRWNNLLEEIAEQLHASKALLQLWQRYKDYSKQCASAVQQQDDRTNELLKAATNKDIADDEVATWIEDCNVCLAILVFPAPHAILSHLKFSKARADMCKLLVCLSMWDSYPKMVLRTKEPAGVSEPSCTCIWFKRSLPLFHFHRWAVFPSFLMAHHPCEDLGWLFLHVCQFRNKRVWRIMFYLLKIHRERYYLVRSIISYVSIDIIISSKNLMVERSLSLLIYWCASF